MKNLAVLVAGGVLVCGGVGVATADSRASRCEEFSGKLTLDWATSCEEFNTIMRKERIFEDAFFLPSGAPAICLAGTMTDAMLGGRAVEAKSLSALTANSFATVLLPGQDAFTAATVVTISADREPRLDKELGQIFLRDTGVLRSDTFAVEQLIGVGGTKKFSKASASMEIVGYEFKTAQDLGLRPAEFNGTICR